MKKPLSLRLWYMSRAFFLGGPWFQYSGHMVGCWYMHLHEQFVDYVRRSGSWSHAVSLTQEQEKGKGRERRRGKEEAHLLSTQVEKVGEG